MLKLGLILMMTATPVWQQASGQASDADSPQAKRAAEVPELIRALSSREAHQRDHAMTLLMEMGQECYGPLREAFNSTPYYDVRRRIRQIALEIYLTEHLGPPRAFLGISHKGQSVTEGMDGRVPAGGTALFITDVFKLSSAQRCGLQNGDLVVALNGKAGTLENQAIEFTRWIGEQAPGTKCEISIIRGGQGIKLIEAQNGAFRPNTLEPAEFRVLTHEQDARVQQGGAAILLERVRGVPIDVPVKDGDLIVALDEEPIPATGAAEMFQNWIEGKWRGRGTFVRNPNIRMMIPQAPDEKGMQSAQILRGGQGLDIPVVLGRWPTYLPDLRQGAVRAGNPGQREQVIETFGAWWRETFDPDQKFSERADDDPNWQWQVDRGGAS